jgi:hypothetical protein
MTGCAVAATEEKAETVGVVEVTCTLTEPVTVAGVAANVAAATLTEAVTLLSIVLGRSTKPTLIFGDVRNTGSGG